MLISKIIAQPSSSPKLSVSYIFYTSLNNPIGHIGFKKIVILRPSIVSTRNVANDIGVIAMEDKVIPNQHRRPILYHVRQSI